MCQRQLARDQAQGEKGIAILAPEGIWGALVGQAKAAGFEVIRDRKRSANGYCDFLKKRIGIRPGIDGLQPTSDKVSLLTPKEVS